MISVQSRMHLFQVLLHTVINAARQHSPNTESEVDMPEVMELDPDVEANLSDRCKRIASHLRLSILMYMSNNLPGRKYRLMVFESDAGDEDWLEPLAASLSIDGITEDGFEPYGVCDGGISSYKSQAQFLFEQITNELESFLLRKGR